MTIHSNAVTEHCCPQGPLFFESFLEGKPSTVVCVCVFTFIDDFVL